MQYKKKYPNVRIAVFGQFVSIKNDGTTYGFAVERKGGTRMTTDALFQFWHQLRSVYAQKKNILMKLIYVNPALLLHNQPYISEL